MEKGAVMRLLMTEGWQAISVVEWLYMWRSAIWGVNVIGDARAICYITVIVRCICSLYWPAGFMMQGTSEWSSTILISNS